MLVRVLEGDQKGCSSPVQLSKWMFYFQRKSCESAWTSRNVNTIHLANNKFSTHFPSKSGFNSTRQAFWQHPSNLIWNLKIQKKWWFVEGIASPNMSIFKVQISFGKCTFLAGGWTTQLKKICSSHWIISPGKAKNKKVWNHTLVFLVEHIALWFDPTWKTIFLSFWGV